MKELLQNKGMMGFFLFIIGIVYINSVNVNSEIKMSDNENKVIVYNK